ncbi:WecB/TagA/CpsF family glycosyltransferase [Fimbriimonas ginsengisoli]|uniref:N-acetylglucosaminyldiphosphoundecaprenol N-acetyl-beta-D-mannosaminyltransferase n=1 Tax=Fimbriimonas ginsengisoli Gsoil 348 TaxID=661478 RepID=A0A068NVF5_FIMGI|nr:WecB/TagA/CpsF family glycosyltransferase [Fimbriimonas ginsengisoli]AIE87503.1 N-acetylglucosaminyldiphosphoundecaprenol N-acetyl-beta-D-mannosaminyltransferase [Fimbriimonas ginsengisoli Gsoil 348]
MLGVEPASHLPDRVHILGVPIDRLSMDQTLARIEAFIASGTPHIVVTADAAGIAQAQHDPALMEIYRAAELVTPDSIGVVWAARRAGHPIETRVSGVDILDNLCRLSAERGYRIFFLGAEPGVADLAAEKMRLRHPGCNIVGTRHGYFPAESDEVVAHEVALFTPDILIVAMGIPRQEKFIRATEHIIQAKVGIGVGGSLDVFSGKAKRAPAIVQKAKMEWLWRTASNPKKIAKAQMLPRFVMLVLRSRRK